MTSPIVVAEKNIFDKYGQPVDHLKAYGKLNNSVYEKYALKSYE